MWRFHRLRRIPRKPRHLGVRSRELLKSSPESSAGPPLQENADVRRMSTEPSAPVCPKALLRTAHRLVTAGGRGGGASRSSGGDAGIAARGTARAAGGDAGAVALVRASLAAFGGV